MRRFFAGIFCCALFLSVLRPGAVSAQGLADAVAGEGTAFAMDLYARLKDTPGNLVVSPYSILTALTMTYAGARGSSALEMAQVLRIDLQGDALHRAFFEHRQGLNAAEGCELMVASALWGQEGYIFLPGFIALIAEYYGGGFDQADFSQGAAAAARINAWVMDKTRGKIQDVVGPSQFNDLTRLVLVNAVYFKGSWAHPFKKIHTQNRTFYSSPRDSKPVAMMNQLGLFFYAEDDMAQVLELPYAAGEMAMVFVLPRETGSLGRVERVFGQERYRDWMSALSERQVDVTLPRFKTTTDMDLAGVMSAMGMPGVFSEAADFSGMSNDPRGLLISGMIHKTFIDVTEEGTEASAVTAVDMTRQGIFFDETDVGTVVFRADHPFLFLIRDRRTDTILFMGRVMDPGVGPQVVRDVLSGMWSQVVGQALQVQKEVLSEKQGSGNSTGQGL